MFKFFAIGHHSEGSFLLDFQWLWKTKCLDLVNFSDILGVEPPINKLQVFHSAGLYDSLLALFLPSEEPHLTFLAFHSWRNFRDDSLLARTPYG